MGDIPSATVEKTEQPGARILDKDTPWQLECSQRERALYREHTKFVSRIRDDFFWLLDEGDRVSSEDVQKRFAEKESMLNPTQADLASRIANNIITRLDQAKRELSEQEVIDRYNTIAEYFDFPPMESGKSEVEMTRFGVLVVTVRDRVLWDQFYEGGAGGRKGGSLNVAPFSLAAQAPLEVQEWIKNTVIIFDNGNGQLENTKRHEMFHALNHSIIESEMVVDYPFAAEREFFLKLKDEVIAYLVGTAHWEYTLRRLLSSFIPTGLKHDTRNKDDELIRVKVEEVIRNGVASELLRSHGFTSWGNFSTQQRKAHGDRRHDLDKQEELINVEIDDATREFMRELFAAQRELARNYILGWQSDAVTPTLLEKKFLLVLSSQSLRELVYKLRELDPRDIDAEQLIVGHARGEVAWLAEELARVGLKFSLPIKNREKLIEAMEIFASELSETKKGKTPEEIEKARNEYQRIIADLKKLAA